MYDISQQMEETKKSCEVCPVFAFLVHTEPVVAAYNRETHTQTNTHVLLFRAVLQSQINKLKAEKDKEIERQREIIDDFNSKSKIMMVSLGCD